MKPGAVVNVAGGVLGRRARRCRTSTRMVADIRDWARLSLNPALEKRARLHGGECWITTRHNRPLEAHDKTSPLRRGQYFAVEEKTPAGMPALPSWFLCLASSLRRTRGRPFSDSRASADRCRRYTAGSCAIRGSAGDTPRRDKTRRMAQSASRSLTDTSLPH